MASIRAAEMVRIMVEEWPDDESAESFLSRMFAGDTFADLESAIELWDEICKADEAEEETVTRLIEAKLKRQAR